MTLAKQMFRATPGSPQTTLKEPLAVDATSALVEDISCFAANRVVSLWNTDGDFESFLVSAVSGTSGTGTITIDKTTVHETSASDNASIVWPSGTTIACNPTAYNENAIISNIEGHETRIAAAESTVSGHTTSITAIQTNQAADETAISGHSARLTTVETNITSLQSAVSSLQTNQTADETTLASHGTRIAALESASSMDPIVAALIFG